MTANSSTFTGACRCGAATFEFDASQVERLDACSCEWCVRLRDFVVSVPTEHVQGTSACPQCGVRLFTTTAGLDVRDRRLVNLRFVANADQLLHVERAA